MQGEGRDSVSAALFHWIFSSGSNLSMSISPMEEANRDLGQAASPLLASVEGVSKVN